MGAIFDSRITFQKLEVFCAVIELGGFGRAAEHLYITQPVVTAHVQSLQKRLGVKLLYRDVHTMQMTDAGERVYRWARATLDGADELIRDLDGLSDGVGGSVTVEASLTVGSYMLPPILAEFRAERPLAVLQLLVFDPDRAMDGVGSGECDFAVVIAEASYDHSALQFELLGHEQLLLVASPDFAPSVTSVRLQALNDMPLIASPGWRRGTPDPLSFTRRGPPHLARDMIDRQLAAEGVVPRNVVLELGHPDGMKSTAQAGLGACLLFRSIVQRELSEGTLREIVIEDAQLSLPVFLVLRSDKRLSPIQEQLAKTIRRRLSESLALGGAKETSLVEATV